jgi:translation initiation factor 3 subunit M
MSFIRRTIIACTFQIRELVDYLARGLSEDNRQKSFGQILELVNTEPPTISKENQAKVLSLLVPEVKGLGEGSEKGVQSVHLRNVKSDQLRRFTPEVEGFFNLLFAHLFSIFPVDSNEIKVHIGTLIKAIVSSKGRFPTRYRL